MCDADSHELQQLQAASAAAAASSGAHACTSITCFGLFGCDDMASAKVFTGARGEENETPNGMRHKLEFMLVYCWPRRVVAMRINGICGGAMYIEHFVI